MTAVKRIIPCTYFIFACQVSKVWTCCECETSTIDYGPFSSELPNILSLTHKPPRCHKVPFILYGTGLRHPQLKQLQITSDKRANREKNSLFHRWAIRGRGKNMSESFRKKKDKVDSAGVGGRLVDSTGVGVRLVDRENEKLKVREVFWEWKSVMLCHHIMLY